MDQHSMAQVIALCWYWPPFIFDSWHESYVIIMGLTTWTQRSDHRWNEATSRAPQTISIQCQPLLPWWCWRPTWVPPPASAPGKTRMEAHHTAASWWPGSVQRATCGSRIIQKIDPSLQLEDHPFLFEHSSRYKFGWQGIRSGFNRFQLRIWFIIGLIQWWQLVRSGRDRSYKWRRNSIGSPSQYSACDDSNRHQSRTELTF